MKAGFQLPIEPKATKETKRGKTLRSLRLLLWKGFAVRLNPSTEKTTP